MEKPYKISEKEKTDNKVKTIKIYNSLFEGQKIFKNWKNNLYHQANTIKNLKEGDEMITTVSALIPGEDCQFKISWVKKKIRI